MTDINKYEIENTNDYELIMLYQENNEDAKNILFLKYKFIIDILIKKYSKIIKYLNIDYQEVLSECNVGFSDGLRSYSEDRNASLPTFITLCVERRIGSLIRKYSREKYKILKSSYSLDYFYDETGENLLNLIVNEEYDPLKNIMDYESYNEFIEEIKKILTDNEYEIFVLMTKNFSYQEIAKILNKTPKQVDNGIQRLKNKIKKLLKEKVS